MGLAFNETQIGTGDKSLLTSILTRLLIGKCAFQLGVPREQINKIDLNVALIRSGYDYYSSSQQVEDVQLFLDLVDADYELNEDEDGYDYQMILRFPLEFAKKYKREIESLLDTEVAELLDFDGKVEWLDEGTICFGFEGFIDEGTYLFIENYYSLLVSMRGVK